MKFGFKKLLSITLIVLLIAFLLPSGAFAQTDDSYPVQMRYPDFPFIEVPYAVDYYGFARGVSAISEDGDEVNDLYTTLFEGFKYCSESIDIYNFGIPYTDENVNVLYSLIWYHMPESFHVYGLGVSEYRGYISEVYASYYDGMNTYDTYWPRYTEMVAAADKFLEGVEGNSNLGDVEKALILHDRLADYSEYDYENYYAGAIPPESHCAYGALVKGVSVCDGYAQAYMYLLNRVGIMNRYCASKEMNHGWNIVYIDNLAYHVDVTHDDNFNIEGKIGHDNFLVSTEFYKNNSTIHNVSDLDSEPQSTRFDNYFWHNSITVMQLIGDTIYYLDNQEVALKKYESGVITKLLDAYSTYGWYFTGYPQNQACLASVGNELLFTSSEDVYSYNITTNKTTRIFSPTEVSNGNQIYGFKYEKGYLVCHLSKDLSTFTVQKKLYDKEAPCAVITSTNDVAAFQKVTLTMSDNVGITGYFWGTNSNFARNTFTFTTATTAITATKTITEAGTYYLTLKDASGNVSKTYSVTFYKTTLDGNGGEVSPKSVLTMSGNSFTFPSATKEGCELEGWATSATAKDGVTTLTPTENSTYFAVWKVVCGDIDGDDTITSADLVELQQHMLNITTINNVSAADMNADGVIDSADLVIIQYMILAM